MQFYQRLRYAVTYTRYGKRHADQLRDKTVACIVATHLARFTGAAVNVFESGATPHSGLYTRLLTTIRPQ